MSNDQYQHTSSNVHIKPNLSYAAIIAEAIICSPEKKLTLREIYFVINSRYPYYDLNKSGWQNSIRHNLSLNKAFYKLPKTNATTMNSKGSYWCINQQDAFIILNKSKRPMPYQTRVQQPLMYNTSSKYNLLMQPQPGYGFNNRIEGRDFGSFSRIDVRNGEDNKETQNFPDVDSQHLHNPFFNGKFDEY